MVNSAGVSATTKVKISCVWEWKPSPEEGEGEEGEGQPPPNLYGSGTGIAVARPGEYWNSAEQVVIPVGGSVNIKAYKDDHLPADSSWSITGPASIESSGDYAVITGVNPSASEYDVVVESKCNDCEQTDNEYLTVVGVTSIVAEPEVVCVGNTNISYKITTQPEGYNYMVSYTPADTSEPGIKEVVASCGTSSATTTVMVVAIEFTSGFDRVSPTQTQTVSVVTYPSPWPDGVSASISAERISGSAGSADVVPITITCSTNISVVGVNQSWGGGNDAAPNNMTLVATFGSCSITNEHPFTVCSHPVDFTHITAKTLAEGVLCFEYGWLSDSGYVAHLDRVWVGEHVSYSDGGIHVAPDRPWKANNPDPTIAPKRDTMSGTWGLMADTHSAPGGLPDSGPEDSYTATQYYGYRCQRCNPGAIDDTLGWQQNIMGPITISRFVEWTGTNWQYRAEKSGVTNIEPLP